MGGGASKKKRQKQKKKRATDPANDEPVPPRDSAIIPDVNASQQKENCQGCSHDDEESKCSIECAAPLENRQPQNLNSAGQVEQLNIGMVERSTYENNTEVKPQAGVHQVTRSEREREGKKVTASHLTEKHEKQPGASKGKQKLLIIITGKQVGTIVLTKPDLHSQHPPVCPPSHKKRHNIEENELNQDIIPNTGVPAKHTEGNDQPEERSESSHHIEKRTTTASTSQQTGKQANTSILNKPDVLKLQLTIMSICISCHKEQKALEANLPNQDIIPDTSVPTILTQSNQPEDGNKSLNHTETRSTIQGIAQQTGNQDSGQQSPIIPMCPPSNKENENVLNQDICLNMCVPTKNTEEADQPEDGSKSSHHTETRATIPHTPQQIGQQANTSIHSKPDVLSQQPPTLPVCIPSNKKQKDLQENVTHEAMIPNIGVPTKHTEETEKKQPEESSNHTETMGTIQGRSMLAEQQANTSNLSKPGVLSQQPPAAPVCIPSNKEQKDLKENVTHKANLPIIGGPAKHTEESDQSKESSHHTETRATIQGTLQQFTETGKGETKTHLTEISKPSIHEMCSQHETAQPQLLEVINGSIKDAKSPTQQQTPGDSNSNAPKLNEKLASTHKKHPIIENKTYKLDEGESQATTNSGNTDEPLSDNSGIPLFTVNQRCPNEAHRRHKPGPVPKVSRFGARPNYLSEAPWITTAKVAAFVALRAFEDREKQMED